VLRNEEFHQTGGKQDERRGCEVQSAGGQNLCFSKLRVGMRRKNEKKGLWLGSGLRRKKLNPSTGHRSEGKTRAERAPRGGRLFYQHVSTI